MLKGQIVRNDSGYREPFPNLVFNLGSKRGFVSFWGEKGDILIVAEVYYIDIFDNPLQIYFTFNSIIWLIPPDQPG